MVATRTIATNRAKNIKTWLCPSLKGNPAQLFVVLPPLTYVLSKNVMQASPTRSCVNATKVWHWRWWEKGEQITCRVGVQTKMDGTSRWSTEGSYLLIGDTVSALLMPSRSRRLLSLTSRSKTLSMMTSTSLAQPLAFNFFTRRLPRKENLWQRSLLSPVASTSLSLTLAFNSLTRRLRRKNLWYVVTAEKNWRQICVIQNSGGQTARFGAAAAGRRIKTRSSVSK